MAASADPQTTGACRPCFITLDVAFLAYRASCQYFVMSALDQLERSSCRLHQEEFDSPMQSMIEIRSRTNVENLVVVVLREVG